MGAQSKLMGLTGSVIGAAGAIAKIAGKDDEKMASKARTTRDNKIKAKKMNIKISRVKIGGKK